MSEALATRKRKLYRILDALSCPPRITSGAGHPSPLIPTSRLHGSPSVTRTLATEGNRQPRRMASSTKLAEYRARLGLGIGNADKRISMISTGSASGTALKPTNTILHKTGSSASLRIGDKERPNSQANNSPPVTRRGLPAFCPWSHEEFLERLRTFAPVTNWLPKPAEEVSEVAWAKRGWSCIGIETVACGACKSRQIIDFSPPQHGRETKRRKVAFGDDDNQTERNHSIALTENGITSQNEDEDHDMHDADDTNDYEYDEAFEKGLVESYKLRIVEGHSLTCPWRQLGCKDDIYHMPVVQREWWERHVTGSFNAALAMAEDIQNLNLRQIETTPSAETILSSLPTSFFKPSSSSQDPAPRPYTPGGGSKATNAIEKEKPRPPPISIPLSSVPKSLQARALTIALTGWTPTTEASISLLSCSACFQRVGLWLYHTPETSTQPDSHLTEDDDDDDTHPAILDLVTQHREHCPFRSPASQSSTGSFANQPAWTILWQTLARWANESKRRSLGPGETVLSPTDTIFSRATGTFTTEITGGLTTTTTKEDVLAKDRERSGKLRKLRKALGIFKAGKKE